MPNQYQGDVDIDGVGDLCDGDIDGDGVANENVSSVNNSNVD